MYVQVHAQVHVVNAMEAQEVVAMEQPKFALTAEKNLTITVQSVGNTVQVQPKENFALAAIKIMLKVIAYIVEVLPK